MTQPAIVKAKIHSVRPVAVGHFEMLLESSQLAAADPGQFVHVRTPGTLRRPISFSRLDRVHGRAGILWQVVGAGTGWLSQQPTGGRLDVLGPLGRGFPAPEADRPWCLIGGGVGIPPLFAALQIWGDSVRAPITAVLGARRGDLLVMVDDFRNRIGDVQVTTDDGSQGGQGTVLGPLAHWRARHPNGQIYACGPTPMLAEVAQLCRGVERVYLALEQRMGCGVGACLACVVLAQGKQGPEWRRVCHDGPVFAAKELVW